MPLPVFAYFAVSAATLNLSWVVYGVVNILMQDAPPTTTPVESSYGYPWEWSWGGPETTDKSQFYVLVGHALSPLQIQQFYAAAWNYWVANDVQEISMYDKLHNLYQDFENMIAFFPLIWKIWEIMLMQVVKAVYSKYFGRARVQLFLINNLLRLTQIFIRLFEQIVCLLWG